MHTPATLDAGHPVWHCGQCRESCEPDSSACRCCRQHLAGCTTIGDWIALKSAEPGCGTIGGSITAAPPTSMPSPSPPASAYTTPLPLPAKTVTDPAAEITAVIYEPLGIDPSLLPAYETVPDGACVTCHTVPRHSGTQCLYCAALAAINIKAALKLPPLPAARSHPIPWQGLIAFVVALYLILIAIGILT